MEDLIKALQIFLKYSQDQYPTHCEHDELIVNVQPNLVSAEDLVELKRLSFNPHPDGHFYSFRFGSC